jgi:hypothetical protein
MRKYDKQKGKIVNEPIAEMTRNEAEQLKEELQNIWETDSSQEKKLKEQLILLEESNVLPSDFPVKEFTELIDKIANKKILEGPPQEKGYLILNFCSIFGMFSPYSTVGFAWLVPIYKTYHFNESPDPFFGYNLTGFLQYAVCGIILPLYGYGYLGTVGLLGYQTSTQITSFIGFILGAAVLELRLEFATPPTPIFDVMIGLAGFSCFFTGSPSSPS